ncbi:MAG TPA: GerMN domain-containing protein [Pilimelia sp.]|nr:GerMN domain-containing protein [Pilimelia sp.]
MTGPARPTADGAARAAAGGRAGVGGRAGRAARGAAVGVVLVLLGGCGVGAEREPRAIASPPALVIPTAGAGPSGGPAVARLYLARDGQLLPVRRPAAAQPTPAALLTQLQGGPTGSEAAAGLTSPVGGTDLMRGVRLDGTVARVELAPAVGGNPRADTLAYAQVVCTLAAHPAVDGVVFTRAGQPVAVPRADASLSVGPLGAADYAALLA